MAIAKFKKLQLIAHNTLRSSLLEELQKIGGVHIIDWREGDLTEQEEPALEENVPVSTNTDAILSKVDHCLKFLKPFEEPQGFMEKLSQSKPQVDFDQLKKLNASIDLDNIYEQCQHFEHQTHELQQHIQHLETRTAELHPWLKLDVPLSDIKETETTFIYTLKISLEDFEDFQKQLEERLGEETTLYEVSKEGDYYYIVLIFIKEEKPLLDSMLVDYEAEKVSLPGASYTPQQLTQEADQKIAEAQKQLQQIKGQSKQLLQHKESLELLYDYIFNQKNQEQVQASFYNTSQTLVLEGWLCASKEGKLKQALEKKFKEIHINIREPLEGEIPPVQLVNNKAVIPFESVTTLYGLPHPGELDPTPLLAPFFFIFFGLCLTDAGYGIIMMILTYWGLRKMTLGEGSVKMFKLLFLAGLATLLAGAITGSWFGDMVDLLPASLDSVKNIKNSLILFDPIKEPLTFMVISLILGYIQVWCGIAIEMYDQIKHKQWADALLVKLPWLVLFLGLGLMGVEGAIGGDVIILIRKAMIYSGLGALLILSPYDVRNPIKRLGMGILEVYNIVAYGSDILSYSRLLALGLATGVIGTVVNKIALLTTGIPVLGYVFMLLIMVGGHLFNLAINALGAFVHTSRLQFVEFFPKFFEGGGKTFSPFRWEGKYSIYREKEAL